MTDLRETDGEFVERIAPQVMLGVIDHNEDRERIVTLLRRAAYGEIRAQPAPLPPPPPSIRQGLLEFRCRDDLSVENCSVENLIARELREYRRRSADDGGLK